MIVAEHTTWDGGTQTWEEGVVKFHRSPWREVRFFQRPKGNTYHAMTGWVAATIKAAKEQGVLLRWVDPEGKGSRDMKALSDWLYEGMQDGG